MTTALSAGDLAERAMRGLPLRGTLSPEAERAVGPELAGLITSGPDQSDDLGREVHSVRVRRAALVAHSTRAWRIELGERAGARTARYPTVSLLLPTRRPEQLEFVLGQVAGLRHRLPGAEVELVLAAHGWEPDAAIVAELSGGLPHTIVTQSADTLFGDVLRAATYAASGRVLVKIDDDDWYAPDFVTDLLLARHYSGAEIVGTPAEFVYVEPRDVTVRRKGPSERYGAVVAGGTMSIEASVLREVGGFRRVRRFVDAQLLDAVLHAGGRVYRTHGLGYVLRRTDSGHTWDPGLDYFLRPETLAGQWAGFSPSGLFEQGGGAG